eukprot:TRINITY_DN9471_c0_g3_i2.p1 TRINITY_DN9471_c0_g3~~TRINITY_DN9471_c0_g3_i2.p1  ORF type:complete len:184 (+),score=43.96 TRINITY_DN9471_c0_g3_i2:25-552(+)
MIRRPPRSTRKESSAASDVYKRQIYSRTEEKIYTTICRCNVLDLICGCCKSCCCDVVLLEMYNPADSSKAFTLTEKCTIHRLLLPIFCMGRVINYEIDMCSSEYPHGIFPIVQACMGVAAKAHFYTRLRNVENAPLKSVLGGRVNLCESLIESNVYTDKFFWLERSLNSSCPISV